MRRPRQLSRSPAAQPPRARVPRVVVRRESVWTYPVAGLVEPSADWRGRLVVESYVAYSDARDTPGFEDFFVPVLSALSRSHSHLTAGFIVSQATFDASFLRECVERCHALGHSTVVEIGGTWTNASLELLWSIRPDFLRIGPEHVHDAGVFPDQFQSLVRVAEFARAQRIPLVARGVRAGEERRVLQAAGVDLFHSSESGAEGHDPLAELETLGAIRPPVLLPFPLRPFHRAR